MVAYWVPMLAGPVESEPVEPLAHEVALGHQPVVPERAFANAGAGLAAFVREGIGLEEASVPALAFLLELVALVLVSDLEEACSRADADQEAAGQEAIDRKVFGLRVADWEVAFGH